MESYNYSIEFKFNGNIYHTDISSYQQLFEKPANGCKPHPSEAKYLLEQIKIFLSQEELPFLPHDIIVNATINNKMETLFSIPDLKAFLKKKYSLHNFRLTSAILQ